MLKGALPTSLQPAMDFRRHTPNDLPAIVSLFTAVFTQSEGAAEGALIGQLA